MKQRDFHWSTSHFWPLRLKSLPWTQPLNTGIRKHRWVPFFPFCFRQGISMQVVICAKLVLMLADRESVGLQSRPVSAPNFIVSIHWFVYLSFCTYVDFCQTSTPRLVKLAATLGAGVVCRCQWWQCQETAGGQRKQTRKWPEKDVQRSVRRFYLV